MARSVLAIRRMSCVIALWTVSLNTTGVVAQTPTPRSGEPPILATVPTLLPGSAPQPQSMSGLPLQVGDLPPGTIAVRIIRGDFAHNVPSHAVELRVDAGTQAAQVFTKTTGPDGRAVFAALPVGRQVQAATVIDGERLESQRFEVPSLGGVRLVLMATGGAGALPTSGVFITPNQAKASDPLLTTTEMVLILGMWAVGAACFWVFGRKKPRIATRIPGSDADRLVEGLLAIEREHRSGRLSAEQYQHRCSDLLANIERISTHTDHDASRSDHAAA